MKSRKGRDGDALDHLCYTLDSMAAGFDQRLCDRGVHPYPAGDRDRCGLDQNYSGTQTPLAFCDKKIPDTFYAINS